MGRFLLLLVALTAAGGMLIQSGGRDGAVRSSGESALDQRYLLAERGAAGGLAAGVSRVSRDFTDWRAGYPETRAGDLTFTVAAEGPAAGPVRLSALGAHGDAQHRVETILSRLANAPAALVLDADTASVSFSGTDWAITGVDARAQSWLRAETPAEGTGYGRAARGIRTRTSQLETAVLDAAGSAREGLVRGVTASADIETIVSPELMAVADAAEATALAAHTLAAPRVFSGLAATSGARYGTADEPVILHVDGNFSSPSGSVIGHGLLLVDGDFQVAGAFEWHGLVIVRGAGTVDVSMRNQASVFGALYLLHEAGYTLGSAFYPFKSMWGIDDETGTLHWFVIGQDSVSVQTEGLLQGVSGPMTYGDRMDVEGFAFMPDGTAYFVNNNTGGDWALYRIPSNQFDGDAATAVQVVRVGNTGVTSSHEVFGLVVKNGILYGLSGDSQRIYRMNTTTGAATTVRTFTTGTSDFAAGGLSLGPDGAVYTNRLKSNGDLDLWRFDQFPSGDPVYVGSLGSRPTSDGSEQSGAPLAVTPDGMVFLHQRTEVRRGQTTGGVESVLDLIADIDAAEMFWEGEGGSSGGQVPNFSTMPRRDGNGPFTSTVTWADGPDITVTTTATPLSGGPSWTAPSYVQGTTLEEMRSAADLNGANPNTGGVPLDYTGPLPLPIFNFEPGTGSNGTEFTVQLDFSTEWTDPFYLYLGDLDYGGVTIIARDAFGLPLSTTSWTKPIDMDVVGVADMAPYTWAPDGAWVNTSGTPGAGRLSHPDATDKEFGLVGLLIPDLRVRSITIEGFVPVGQGDFVGFSLSNTSLWDPSGALPIPSFSMANQARIIHSAEAIGKLASLLGVVEGSAYLVTHDRFGRDLPRPTTPPAEDGAAPPARGVEPRR